ncbi:MAG: heavy metal translocating P-type ATPase [Polyangiales bacterium]
MRDAEDGTKACQLELSFVLPDENNEIGRFEKLEAHINKRAGISDIHIRRDLGWAEVCIHYDPSKGTQAEVIALVRASAAEIARRYKAKSWFVRGMDSAQSGYHIEYALSRLKGVLEVNVSYGAERLFVEYDVENTSPGAIEKRVEALGFELEEPEEGHACCSHSHGGGLAPKLEVPLSVAAGVTLAVGLGVEHFAHVAPIIPTLLYASAGAMAGFFPVRGAFTSVKLLKFDIETLTVLAAVGAAVLGAWFEAGLLLFLFSLGHALEHRALERARRAIDALGKLRPETARVRRGGEVVDVPVSQVKRGDRVLVRPGDRVPLDGVIREGRSSLDQSTVTGESVPVSKGPGENVFAGTINAESAIDVEVTRLSNESAIAKVITLVAEAEARKGKAQRFTKKIEQKFAPLVLLAAPTLAVVLVVLDQMRHADHALTFSVKESLLRAISLLVAASPCALAISTPAAVLSAVARAARGGVLMKGGAHLEELGSVTAMAFDKTGTLTVGKPRLVSIWTAEGVTEGDLLSVAAGVESLSSHPLAKAVVDGAKAKGFEPARAVGCEAVHGKGIRSMVGGKAVAIGSLDLFDAAKVPEVVKAEVLKLQDRGQTTMVVRRGLDFIGVIGVADTLRPEAKKALAEIARARHHAHRDALGRQPPRGDGHRQGGRHRRASRAPHARGQGQRAQGDRPRGRRRDGRRRRERRAGARGGVGGRGDGRRGLRRGARDGRRGAHERRPRAAPLRGGARARGQPHGEGEPRHLARRRDDPHRRVDLRLRAHQPRRGAPRGQHDGGRAQRPAAPAVQALRLRFYREARRVVAHSRSPRHVTIEVRRAATQNAGLHPWTSSSFEVLAPTTSSRSTWRSHAVASWS